MTMRPFTDARGGLNHLVDAQIGRAFPVVHKVYQHLDAIEYVAKVYEDGRARDIVLRTNHTKEWIEWQYKGEAKWTILFKFSDLLGADIADVVAAEQAIAAELAQLRQQLAANVETVTEARTAAAEARLGAEAARDAASESQAAAAQSVVTATQLTQNLGDATAAAEASAVAAQADREAAQAAQAVVANSAQEANTAAVAANAARDSAQGFAAETSAAKDATSLLQAAAAQSQTAAGDFADAASASATAAALSESTAASHLADLTNAVATTEAAAAASAQHLSAIESQVVVAGLLKAQTETASQAAVDAQAAAEVAANAAEQSATAAANSSAQALTRANAAGASATLAEQSSQTAQAFKAAAEASAVAAADSAADSAAAASLSEGFSIQAGESASDAAASALLAQNANAAAQAETAIVQAASTSAQAAATAASTSATNAATSADAASQSELASGMSEIAAAASEASAQAAKTAAELAKNAAASSAVESAASAAAALASKEGAAAVVNTVNEARDAALAHTATAKAWADKVDGAVEPGKYSARYWAEITAGAATGGVVYMGTWSAAGGVFPSNPGRGHLYKVFAAGEIAGESYSVKDMIIFNGASWDKIDSTDEVTSVAGRMGAVLLTKADVGLENVDNTADMAKPVSAAQQAALNQKQDTLVSGASIKRLNGESLLGSGDVTISKSSLGLGNVDNTTDLDKPVSTAQRAALEQKQNNLVTGANLKTVNGQDLLGAGDVAITKGDVGLANVDNTSDADKPVSTAQREALDRKQDALVSGENIKTINGMSILGGGDIVITNGDELAVPRLNSLLVYYGHPIAYKGIWNADAIVAEISASHDYWVVGHSYQDPAHGEYASTVAIMRGVRAAGVKLYGYIPLGTNSYNYTVAQIEAITDQWMAIGVDGIFIDEYGFDYGNTRQRQVDVVNMIHTKGLPICANAWVMEEFVTDSLAETGWPSGDWRYVSWQARNPTNIPSPAQPGDSYLFENFCYDHLGPTTVWNTQERAERARALALQNDVSVWGVAVFAETTPGTLDTAKLGNLATLPAAGEYISANAYLYDINVVGSGGFSFGSNGTPLWAPLRQLPEGAQLPARPAENNYTDKTGTRYFGPVKLTVTNTDTTQGVEVVSAIPAPLGDVPKAPLVHAHAIADVTGLQAALDGKEPTIAAGTATQYWRGDKTWSDFFTDVRAATLTGLSTATRTVVAATDTVLAAIGKLQAQVSAKAPTAAPSFTGTATFQGVKETLTTANTGTAYTVANTASSILDLTLTGNCVLTYPAPSGGGQFTLLLKQDATGSRTVTWPSTVRWAAFLVCGFFGFFTCIFVRTA